MIHTRTKLETLTVKALRSIAAELSITGTSRMRKDEIISTIIATEDMLALGVEVERDHAEALELNAHVNAQATKKSVVKKTTKRLPERASVAAPGRVLLTALKPGDRIMLAKNAQGVVTLPVYTRHLDTEVTVLEPVKLDNTAVVPCLALLTDHGIVRGSATTHVTPC